MDIRFGKAEDTQLIISYILQAGDGTFEYLLDGCVPGMSTNKLMQMSVTDEQSPYYYGNAVFAHEGDAILGMILAIPSEDVRVSEILEQLVASDRRAVYRKLVGSIGPGSWYVNTLVVEESAQGSGVGRVLLSFAAEVADQIERDTMSLHVWSDNPRAQGFYLSLGFSEVSRFTLDLSKRGLKCDDMILMSARLPLSVPSDSE